MCQGTVLSHFGVPSPSGQQQRCHPDPLCDIQIDPVAASFRIIYAFDKSMSVFIIKQDLAGYGEDLLLIVTGYNDIKSWTFVHLAPFRLNYQYIFSANDSDRTFAILYFNIFCNASKLSVQRPSHRLRIYPHTTGLLIDHHFIIHILIQQRNDDGL